MNWLKAFWYSHVQKTVGSALLGLAGVDLTAAVAGYQDDITQILGARAYAAIRVAGLAAIVYRAISHKNRPEVP